MPDEVGGDVGLDAVSQGPERRRDGHRRIARAVYITDVGEVQHEPGWDSKTAPAPTWGHSQVDLSGKRVGEIVEREGRLMGEHPGLLGPEPEHDEVLVLAGREMHDAVDATSHAHHPPRRQVLVKEWTRIARLGGLSRREVAALGLRDGEKAIPVRLVRCLRSYGAHDARMLTQG